MNVELEDIIALLKELEDSKIKLALVPHEFVHKQYAMLGVVDGVKSAIRKLDSLLRRENY